MGDSTNPRDTFVVKVPDYSTPNHEIEVTRHATGGHVRYIRPDGTANITDRSLSTPEVALAMQVVKHNEELPGKLADERRETLLEVFRMRTAHLIEEAKLAGVVITIETVPNDKENLCAGDYHMESHVRIKDFPCKYRGRI